MPEGQLQHPWPDPPPGPSPSRGTRLWTVLHTLHARGWLRPRRIGCLLLILVILLFALLWAVSSVVNGITAMFRPPPVAGSPFDKVTPTVPASTGPLTADLILDGRLAVAVQETPGLAERAPGAGGYVGFDIALLELVARDLGTDPAEAIFKPVPTNTAVGMLTRGEANLALGGFTITPQRGAEVGIVGPYLESELRLAVPATSTVTGLNTLGRGEVCAPRNSPAAETLAGKLGDRLTTRASLGACENLLGQSVMAIIGDDLALRHLPAMANGELRLVGDPLGTTEYGIAVAPEDEVLRQRVTAVLRTAIADGTWARLYAEYLGTPVPEPPIIR
ncbi:MAG: transporter substrate-binding domain-containing protein [Pseudonocardiaceae bacterium]